MGRRTALIYLAAVAGTALACGITLNWILPNGIETHMGGEHTMLPGWFASSCAVVLFIALGAGILGVWRKTGKHPVEHEAGPLTKFKVGGMTCEHCAGRIHSALMAEQGVLSAHVSLADGTVDVHGAGFDMEHMTKAVEKLGYSLTESER